MRGLLRPVAEVQGKLRTVLRRNANVALKDLVDVKQNGGLGEVRPVVLLRKVGQGDAVGGRIDHLGQELPGLVVGEVPPGPPMRSFRERG